MQCHHDFKADREEEYEQKLLKSINAFSSQIPAKSNECFVGLKQATKNKVILDIINKRQEGNGER